MRSAITQPWTWTPAQIAALAFGVWWIGNAVAVFLVVDPKVAALETNGTVDAFGVSIVVNGWHGLLHLSTGLAGLGACWWPRSSRVYVLLIGALYFAAAFCGLFLSSTVFGLIRVNEFGSIEHAIEGAVLVAVGMAFSRNAGRTLPANAQ
jgi:hypothetical protein